MADIYDLVPKHKFDDENIEKLKQLTDEEIAPILPRLLEWIQDINWPVARELLPVMALHQSILIPLIIDILKPEEKDDIWKYWIIGDLLPLFSDENIKPIIPSIKRLAEKATPQEKLEELDEKAAEFLQDFYQ